MIDGELIFRWSFLGANALDGNLHPCFDDRSRSLTDHPCNGTSGLAIPTAIEYSVV